MPIQATINFSLPSGTTAIILTSDQLLIGKDLTISGPGAESVERGAEQGPRPTFFHFRIFTITTGNVTISGLTIVTGNPLATTLAAAIYNAGTLTIAQLHRLRQFYQWH